MFCLSMFKINYICFTKHFLRLRQKYLWSYDDESMKIDISVLEGLKMLLFFTGYKHQGCRPFGVFCPKNYHKTYQIGCVKFGLNFAWLFKMTK